MCLLIRHCIHKSVSVLSMSSSGVYKLEDIVPVCHKESWVAPTASVIGNVVLKEDASVWFGAVVRGDSGGDAIVIGEGSNIQDNSVYSF